MPRHPVLYPLRQALRRQRPAAAALVAGLGLLAGCGGDGGDGDAPAPLTWGACGDFAAAPFECATASVPLDTVRPGADRIELQVIRRPASDPARRLGALFFNPGGPGGKGTDDLPAWIDAFPPALLQRFDLVSWDPRGIGRSTAVRCFGSLQEEREFKARMAPGFPVGDEQVQQQAGLQASFNQRCAQRAGSLLEHVSTADSARDMDHLRRALGEARMNYLGVSYGTLLGATYANLFPDRVRAMVLDGNMDPVAYFEDEPLAGTTLRIDNDLATAETLQQFAARCAAAGTARCGFAATDAAATAAKFEALAARLAAQPVAVDAFPGVSFTEPALLSITAAWLFVVREAGGFPGWSALAGLLQDLWVASGGDAATPVSGTVRPASVSSAASRPASSRSTSARPTAQAAADDSAYDSDGGAWAVQCGESPNPRDPLAYPQVAAFAVARAGRIGAAGAWGDAPCATWPARAASTHAGPWNRATAPILVIGNRYDPSTAYSSSVRMASLLANARLLTVEGYGHTVLLNPSRCASDAQAAYFIDGTLPPQGTTCVQDTQPFEAAAATGP